MIGPGTGVRVYLACRATDLCKGIEGLAVLAQDHLRQKPTGGAVFAFRGGSRGPAEAFAMGCSWVMSLLQGSAVRVPRRAFSSTAFGSPEA